jgi:hypothetical protein
MTTHSKRVLLNMLTKPMTLVPAIGGASLLLLSPVAGATLGFVGFCLLLVGAGVFATNAAFNMEKFSAQALAEAQEEKQRAREARLGALAENLAKARGRRSHDALQNMRTVYAEFVADIRGGQVNVHGAGIMLDRIEELYEGCIGTLERSYKLWELGKRMTGDGKAAVGQQRDELLAAVESSLARMVAAIGDVRALSLKAGKSELAEMSDRMTQQLEAAKEVERQLNELDADPAVKYAEYLTQ